MDSNKQKRKECRLNFEVSEKFKCWLAGLLDGEGNFYVEDGKRVKPMVRIALIERDKFVLDYIVSNVGGILQRRGKQKSWKAHWSAQYCWTLHSFYDCLRFTEWILPELVLKKETAQKFLETLRRRE